MVNIMKLRGLGTNSMSARVCLLNSKTSQILHIGLFKRDILVMLINYGNVSAWLAGNFD